MQQPHLVRGPGFDKDPSLLESSVVSIVNQSDGAIAAASEFALLGMGLQPVGPISWWDIAETYYDTPLQMHYTGLDRNVQYRVRVVYLGDPQREMRLMANDRFEVHPLIRKEPRPLEFDIPAAATAEGELTLSWNQAPGSSGAGRGCQVAEVWLIKK